MVDFKDASSVQIAAALSPLRPRRDVGVKSRQLLVDLLPTCTNLIELHIPDLGDGWFNTFDPAGSTTAYMGESFEKVSRPTLPP